MKYWFIFTVLLTTLFGGICATAISSSQDYLISVSSNCYKQGYVMHCDSTAQY